MKKYRLFSWWSANIVGLLGISGLLLWEYFKDTSAYDLSFTGVLVFAITMSVLFLLIVKQADCQKNSAQWLVGIAIFLWCVLCLVITQNKSLLLWWIIIALLFYIVSGCLAVKHRLKCKQ